jgi:hypothetical protein
MNKSNKNLGKKLKIIKKGKKLLNKEKWMA